LILTRRAEYPPGQGGAAGERIYPVESQNQKRKRWNAARWSIKGSPVEFGTDSTGQRTSRANPQWSNRLPVGIARWSKDRLHGPSRFHRPGALHGAGKLQNQKLKLWKQKRCPVK